MKQVPELPFSRYLLRTLLLKLLELPVGALHAPFAKFGMLSWQKAGLFYPDFYIICNLFSWDPQGDRISG